MSHFAFLRAEVAAAKKANAATPDDHDYFEAETRDLFIDLLLKEAGWPLDQKRDREFEVVGMPTEKGVGYADCLEAGFARRCPMPRARRVPR